MPNKLAIQLLAVFGPPAIDGIGKLIAAWESNGTVTAAQWEALTASLRQSAADHMKAQLAAAGIPLDDPHAVALLGLAK